MTRIYTPVDEEKPLIDKSAILDFFEKRAEKVEVLGPICAVIYQDKNPGLAERRDAAEKGLLLPLIEIDRSSNVLDAGCGTGRWAEVIIPECAYYHGVDLSPGLIRVARERFAQCENAQFSVCTIDKLSIETIGATTEFSHILSFGVFIYLNDNEVLEALRRYVAVAASKSRIMFREPIALLDRLTLLEHFSDDMNQQYNAIYRTEMELFYLVAAALEPAGFYQIGSGDVYVDAELNNRTETKQRWFLWGRE